MYPSCHEKLCNEVDQPWFYIWGATISHITPVNKYSIVNCVGWVLGVCNTCVRLQSIFTSSDITVDNLTVFVSFFFSSFGKKGGKCGGKGLGYKQWFGFSWEKGVDVLIGINTRVLGSWLCNKIFASKSGGALLLGQLGQFHFFYTKRIYLFICLFIYFLMLLGLHWQIYLFVYLFT